jgi:hypothetical protein
MYIFSNSNDWSWSINYKYIINNLININYLMNLITNLILIYINEKYSQLLTLLTLMHPKLHKSIATYDHNAC